MDSDDVQVHIPEIDFRGLEPSNPCGDLWDSVRAEAMAALKAFGCFQAVYQGLRPELKEELFGRAMPECFALPLETKKQNSSRLLYHGYIGQIPHMAYESMRILHAPNREAVDKFTHLMWPDGNPNFCNIVWTFSKQIQKLEQMVQRMILQSLGLEKYYDSHIESLAYGLRISEYGVPLDQETKIALPPHIDPNMITIVIQHQEDGLEVQASNGEWIPVASKPNSFNVMVGESFGAWSNGRLKPPLHRVRITSNRKRYSALFSSVPGEDSIVQTPQEMINEEHPLLYKPYKYSDFLEFRYGVGRNAKDALKAFCGTGKDVEAS